MSAARRLDMLGLFRAAPGNGVCSGISEPGSSRTLSVPTRVAEAGGLSAWNAQDGVRATGEMLARSVTANTVVEALAQVKAIMGLGHLLHAYAYMRALFERNADLYYATLLAAPSLLLPVVYTPTVGEACQKFGLLPLPSRGCYVSLKHKGRVLNVLREYAQSHCRKEADGTYGVDCIVFSDGGR
ncbi:hypothetical protein T492DRAFT_141120 [Pavlovales sp. CCMP2436]|nr:hypothetical protein T492DRAFT_141120 [Pavlovales sp. CCMP2436]